MLQWDSNLAPYAKARFSGEWENIVPGLCTGELKLVVVGMVTQWPYKDVSSWLRDVASWRREKKITFAKKMLQWDSNPPRYAKSRFSGDGKKSFLGTVPENWHSLLLEWSSYDHIKLFLHDYGTYCSKLSVGEKITFVKKNAPVGFEPASIREVKIFGWVGKSRSWAPFRRTDTRCCWDGHTMTI